MTVTSKWNLPSHVLVIYVSLCTLLFLLRSPSSSAFQAARRVVASQSPPFFQATRTPPATIDFRLFAMSELPSTVEKYSQVPGRVDAFTATTIPSGLSKNHSTKDGTWGVIRILQGLLEYTIEEETFELSVEHPGIIEPNKKHSVKPITDDVEFVVEFWRAPDTGPVDEPRDGL
jgi:tellurite resistance-related uncharacterized protein